MADAAPAGPVILVTADSEKDSEIEVAVEEAVDAVNDMEAAVDVTRKSRNGFLGPNRPSC